MNVSNLMSNAKVALTQGNKEIAGDFINKGIITLSKLTMEGVANVDGATVDRWKERFWFELEVNDLIED